MSPSQRGARYLEIAEDLADRLADLGPEGRLPTETELAERYRVNRLTARAAIQELERRLLVRRFPGRGTFVTRRIDYLVSARTPPSWHETVRLAGAVPRVETEAVEVLDQPDSHVREVLDLRADEPVVVVTRRRYVDDDLAGCADLFFPAALVPDLAEGLEPTASVHRYLRDHCRLDPFRGWSEVSFEVAPASVAARLGQHGRPMLFRHHSRIDSATLRRPVEYAVAWLRPEIVRVRVCYGEAHHRPRARHEEG